MASGTLPPPPVNEKPGSFIWLEWYRQLRNYVATSGSVPWYIINFAGSKITDISERLHNTLQGLQGGSSGEMYHLTASQYSTISSGVHNALLNLQGGTSTERYHVTSAQANTIANLGPLATKAAGYTGTVTLAKLTSGGANGSMTFSEGILISVTQPT